MGKPAGKKKNQVLQKSGNVTGKPSKPCDRSSKAFDEDTAIFINMAQELKEEANKLFQKRDYEGAMLKFEKAVKLLPRNHIDVASLRTNMASCYMQLGLGEYPRAITQCNLALEVSPKYGKALLKRARCYESLNRLDLAYRDVNSVLSMEPNNSTALEIVERLRKVMGEKGIHVDEKELVVDDMGSQGAVASLLKGKAKKKKIEQHEAKKAEGKVVLEEKVSVVNDKEVVATIVQEEILVKEEEVAMKMVKLVLGEDIRWAKLPVNCSVGLVRKVARDRFPSLKGVLVKYRDQEGDLVTITTTNELRLAEESGDSQGSFRLYIVEVSPDQEPAYGDITSEEEIQNADAEPIEVLENVIVREGEKLENASCSIEDWLVQFARLFKYHVGFNSDSYLELHELGMNLYSEAMEDTVTGEDAQQLFEIAAEKFQEMAALALFNWGNVHMYRARKQVILSEDGLRESMLVQVKSAYEWAQKEYGKAEMRYEEATKIKPDFYDGMLALGLQQFEQAKLCWYYALTNEIDLESAASEVLQLYNKAEDSMERGMQMWEELEEQRLNGLSKFENYKSLVEKMGLSELFNDISSDEASEQGANMTSQIYLLWGSLLYERSIVEYKLELPTWEECLEVSVEKFELAGASHTDIAVMMKNHCSNENALEGLGFKIDEIVQAWHEMYDAKRSQIGVPSFRLEPLFRRRVPKLNYILEHV